MSLAPLSLPSSLFVFADSSRIFLAANWHLAIDDADPDPAFMELWDEFDAISWVGLPLRSAACSTRLTTLNSLPDQTVGRRSIFRS